jgi:hypothetical protein
LQPGEETDLSLEFLMHDGMAGPHDFRVEVRTNDKQAPNKELAVLSNWQ